MLLQAAFRAIGNALALSAPHLSVKLVTVRVKLLCTLISIRLTSIREAVAYQLLASPWHLSCVFAWSHDEHAAMHLAL
jgi:hypothetical protein